ncbi:MAG: hypothetical protein I8H77_08960 [Comamonadaceae bacterium]|nr:hypothetical protein [Comamonadaceae bacterium]
MEISKGSLKPKLLALLVFLLLVMFIVIHVDGRDVGLASEDLPSKPIKLAGHNESLLISDHGIENSQGGLQEKNPDPDDSPDSGDATGLRLNVNGSYRAFYESALKNPEKGGIFYASRILRMCSAIRNETTFGGESQTAYSVEMDDEVYGKISAAAEGLRAKCSMFTPDELSDHHINEVLKSEASLKDPLISAGKALGEDSGFEQLARRKKLVDDVIKLGDPLLISELGMRLALYRHSATGQLMFKFGGDEYPLDSEVDVGFALYMLPCNLGMQCDENEFDMAMRCASNAGCYEGRVDYVRKVMTAGSRDFDGTKKLCEQMAEAAKKGDLSKFMN